MKDAGFIQVVVLGALAGCAALIAIILPQALSANTGAAALERLVRAEMVATSGFRRTIAAFDSDADMLEVRALAAAVALDLGGTQSTIALEAESEWSYAISFLPGLKSAGGTEEILRNTVGERVLGLPPEPRLDKGIPFSELRAKEAVSQ